jgi:acyl-CoA-binding protein
MRYLTTRDIFLSTINKEIQINESTFTNDITFGGSLLGRLVNSIIRKGKVQINYKKVEPIAKEIEDELDKLLAGTLDEEQKASMREIITKALLEEIYSCVNSNSSEIEKINQLLDKPNNDGLITLAIKYIKASPADADYGKGDKNTLISQLEKFKSELEALKAELEEGAEDKQDASDEFYVETVNLLKSVVALDNIIKSNTPTTAVAKVEEKPIVKKPIVEKPIEPKEQVPTTKDNISKLSSGDKKNTPELNSGTTKPTLGIAGPTNATNDSLMNFWNFFSQLNEKQNLIGTAPQDQKGEFKLVSPGVKKPEAEKSSEYIDFETTNSEESKVWNNILLIYKKSKVNSHIAVINNLLKSENKNEIINIGKQIIDNKEKYKPVSFESISENVDTISIANSISYLSRFLLALRENTKSAEKGEQVIGQFINAFDKMSELSQPISKTENFNIVDYIRFVKINEVNEDSQDDTQGDNEENSEENSEEAEAQSTQEKDDRVRLAWSNNFQEGEENEWKLNMEKANKVAAEIDKNTKPLTDEELRNNDNTKDHILKIADLFGKAYRCYATGTIPSGRPGDRISGKTFREYKYIGKGTPPVPSETAGPGYGPWANIKVYNNFTDKIMNLIQNKKYGKIFSAGVLKRPDGTTMKKGNVLMEFMRDMIDEEELKSYEANRARLLTKYFNLDSNKLSGIDTTKQQGPEKDERKDSSKVRWLQQVQNLPLTSLEKGSFIALNVNYNSKGKPVAGGSVIVGQVIGSNEGKIFLKFSYDTEAINNAYSGYRILPEEERLDGCSIKNDKDVRIGVIDLRKTPIDEDKKFIMSFLLTKDLDKDGKMKNDTQIFKHHFTPFKHLKKRSQVARKTNVPVCILSKKNAEDKWETIIGEIGVKQEVTQDKKLTDKENLFNQLLTNLQDQNIKIT